jgi:hypothetical protein
MALAAAAVVHITKAYADVQASAPDAVMAPCLLLAVATKLFAAI